MLTPLPATPQRMGALTYAQCPSLSALMPVPSPAQNLDALVPHKRKRQTEDLFLTKLNKIAVTTAQACFGNWRVCVASIIAQKEPRTGYARNVRRFP